MAAYSFGILTCLSAIVLAALAVVMFLHDFKHQFCAMLHHGSYALLTFAGAASTQTTSNKVDLSWYPPKQTQINNLTAVMAGEGTYGWIYNSSETPDDRYGTYNWCNMPHVRKQEYVIPSSEYNLIYVELIHRHHKRTPYSSNSFPVEPYPWNCDDVAIFHHSQPLNSTSTPPSIIPAYWKLYSSPISPFAPQGWTGTCQFPQITLAGLSDSHRHGSDLFSVYGPLLSLSDPGSIQFRVTTNPITTQVAGAVLPNFFTSSSPPPSPSLPSYAPLLVQQPQLDSLEPKYACPLSSSLFSSLQSPSNTRWQSHLSAAAPLFRSLDSVSGVPAGDKGFHASMDHYYDNLSARQCHGLPSPCSLAEPPSSCITQAQTDLVYRLGQWEYDHVYRSGGPDTLRASSASMGVWFAELAENLRGAAAAANTGEGEVKVKYRHNIAHDGSLSRVLSVLQVDEMVWPGMGAEVVFELYEKINNPESYFVRVLWGGRVLRSSNPSLGVMDMVDLDLVLGYFDGLVGEKAEKVKGLCGL
ncbi:counting factor 60 [Cladorrhinum samala]|uniref:Counting factor 60 n=1 Tax=Cladorrhinum samala TaxID=585594 RepID=A0AAV9HYL9_9PEZI|nr:counting factor 60 [Cladorrhinum samala]